MQTENKEILEICNRKAGSNYRNQNLSSTTAPLQWFHIDEGGDEQIGTRKKEERTEKRGKKAALVVLSHIVSPQRFGTWSIYTLLVDIVHTYLGGVDRWSRWPIA